MAKYAFIDGERIRKAHSVGRIEPIFQHLAVEPMRIPELRYIKFFPERLAASNILTQDGKKNPVVKIGAEGIVGVELLVDESTKVVQFYALTSAVRGCGRRMVEAVVGATPEDWHLAVVFDSSGGFWRNMTAEILDDLWERFCSALDPLRSAKKLGVVLFQFAPWFVFRPSSLDLIAACAARLPGDRIAVEFRNKSWFAENHLNETIAFEREHGLVHVVVDEPQGFPSSVPAAWEVTSPDLSIVRLHGRNRATWAKKGISVAERFNYLYSDEELREISGPANELGKQAGEVHVLFNNCYCDNAQRNALALQALMNP
jgi:uncharacterized protein YecE (DUF72 family)